MRLLLLLPVLALAACQEAPTLARTVSAPTAETPAALEVSAPEGAVATPDTSHLAPATVDVSLPVATVWKTPACGCCAAWISHLRSAGFRVDVRDTLDLAPIKLETGVPSGLGSCHTARIGDYVVEGHVPAADIKRLLAERPSGVKGIAVPGMPTGSPGMEVPGRPADPYDVIAFGDGGQTVFASHR